ncbi:PucR family transcriptional regulator [Candidatus Formimonas warabiya]|uniref:PucR family transcriptional regulator n=1 Tax=Formimonas warabiya TaxID=1761012 RepID=A0A3G1KQY9_FORW1|nr:PucR family transcriptional regulator [Candidatus Formimonas warabiya]ATW24860.1 hypothetical protein DCMF_08810 [Candidatus Formimonas warabiya]
MEISLKDLLSCDFFSASKVLAGQSGLSNIVSSVTVLDSPDIAKYLRGGELVITTGYSLLNDENNQKIVLESLAKKGAAALGIKLRFFGRTLPRKMEDLGNRLNVPIISIPDEYAYTEIYDFINLNMVSKLTKEVKRVEEVYKEINYSVFTEGLAGLAKILYKWSGLRAVVLFQHVIYDFPAQGGLEDFVFDPSKWREILTPRNISSGVSLFQYVKNDFVIEWLSAEIVEKGKSQGNILLLKNDRDFDKNDFNILDYAASACAVEVQRIKSIIDINRKYRTSFLESFLHGKYSWEEAKFQAGQLDFEIPNDGMVVIISFDNMSNELHEINFINDIDYLITKIFGRQTVFGLVENKHFVLFIPNDLDKYSSLLNKIYHEVINVLKVTNIIIGLGRPATFQDVAKSYEEAKIAIQIGSCLDLNPRIYYFHELGFFRILKVSQEVNQYYEDYLKPLTKQSGESDVDLLETLECFFESGCNYRETAKKMFMHPNTVRYRISVIEKLCRVNLKLASDRLNMEIALKLLPLISAKNKGKLNF